MAAEVVFYVEGNKDDKGIISYDEDQRFINVDHEDTNLVTKIMLFFVKSLPTITPTNPALEDRAISDQDGLRTKDLFVGRANELWGELGLWVDWPQSSVGV